MPVVQGAPPRSFATLRMRLALAGCIFSTLDSDILLNPDGWSEMVEIHLEEMPMRPTLLSQLIQWIHP